MALWIPDFGDLRNRILTYTHGSITSGHPGIAKTVDRLRRNYYWPEMQSEATSMVRRCHSCQIRKATTKDPGQVKSITTNNPMELWSVDLVGPLTETPRRAKYILTMVDHFTRLADALPLTSKKAEEVGRALLDLTVRHGTPHKILSDRGGEFMSLWTKALHQDLRVKGISTSSYAPQTNGKVERFHRTLEDILSTLVSREEDDWDERLPLALFAYNTQVHTATGFTPFFLNHFRHARHPWQQTPILPELGRTPGGWKTEMANKAARVYDQVRRRLKAQREKVEEQAEDVKDLLNKIQPGDLVILRMPKPVITKLGPRSQGPAKVLKVSNDGLNYTVEWPSGNTTTEHIRRLRRYNGDPATKEVVEEPQDLPRCIVPGKTHEKSQKSTHKKSQKSQEEEEEDREEIAESIEGKSVGPDGILYRVRWRGLLKQEWVPREELVPKCNKLIKEFENRDRAQRTKARNTKKQS